MSDELSEQFQFVPNLVHDAGRPFCEAGGSRLPELTGSDAVCGLPSFLARAQDGPELDFVLHYQPIVELATSRIVGAEALLRCRKPEAAAFTVAELIAHAERTGSIVRLGHAVMRTAIQQQMQWRKLGFDGLQMNVNVSAVELLDPAYLQQLDEVFEEASYVPDGLTLELTESVPLPVKQQDRLMKGLMERGLSVAIDDFGVGYSNLSYLRRFPISQIKTDREFLQRVPAVQHDAKLLRAILSLAQSLACDVIAEGVETEAQRQFLQELGCSKAQGFFFSPPVSADKFVSLLACGAARGGAPVEPAPI